jgi:hypothetical protein
VTAAPEPLPIVTEPAPNRGPGDSPVGDPCLHVMLALREHVARDHRLRGSPVRVLLYLLPELLDRRHRVVKQVVLAKALRMGQPRAAMALRELVTVGLLELGPADGSLRTYRISTTLLSHFGYPKRMSERP